MTSFYLSEKKFLKLAPHNRHKWLVKWLSDIYGKLAANRLGPARMEEVYALYAGLLDRMGLVPDSSPEKKDRQAWIEFISDAVHFHRAAMGISPKDYDLLPEVGCGDMNQENPLTKGPDYSIALDSFRSLFNVGSAVRVCDAAGFQSVIVGGTLSGKSASMEKTAMGATEWVPVEKTDDLASLLQKKKERNCLVVGIETVPHAVPYFRFEWPSRGIVVFGNEEYGISRHVMRTCDHFVQIPMLGRKNSINAANSVAVIAFHIAFHSAGQAGRDRL
ncbi:MAG: TrmH family RNA methyltransferase [Thermodesulfobacteriota bacterium]